jgi:hypothetical protein
LKAKAPPFPEAAMLFSKEQPMSVPEEFLSKYKAPPCPFAVLFEREQLVSVPMELPKYKVPP